MAIVILKEFVTVQVCCEFCGFQVASFYVVLEILYVVTVTLPHIFVVTRVKPLRLFKILLHEFLFRKDNRFHACLVQGVCLRQVQDIKLDFARLVTLIHNFEVEPLGVTFRIQIILEP